ncbi:bifunctional pyr operon transcriptional regulator/uracil phosphoribosyltransferase PyrR [Bermanella sp. R86510]|uniref:bifunctional pyr operon transcriptional regulator/uracil phosphoribosyltransferase PyrR n=1 Tax=unclassified Bermanella TaxID=2627862 RepID=UPI0037CAE7F5
MALPQPTELINAMAQQLSAQLDTTSEKVVIVGIHTGGAWVADALHKALNATTDLGLLDISFYRDDFTQKGLHPEVKSSKLPGIEGKTVILVDDVIMSGRTIRAAMNELFDYGRPNKIVLTSLIDVGHRELPIQADVVGARFDLEPNQRIKLEGPSPLALRLANINEARP